MDAEEAAESQEQELRSETFELLRQNLPRALRPPGLLFSSFKSSFNYQYQFVSFFLFLLLTVAAIQGGGGEVVDGGRGLC